MKKLLNRLAICAVLFFCTCTTIEVNNDPVIGIWLNEPKTKTTQTKNQTTLEEWIFNDAYLGRYHRYSFSNITISTDFKWIKTDSIYHVSYPGTDFPKQQLLMQETDKSMLLKDLNNTIIAIKNPK